MQAILSIPESRDGRDAAEELLFREIGGVPLLIRAIATASRAGADEVLLIFPGFIPCEIVEAGPRKQVSLRRHAHRMPFCFGLRPRFYIRMAADFHPAPGRIFLDPLELGDQQARPLALARTRTKTRVVERIRAPEAGRGVEFWRNRFRAPRLPRVSRYFPRIR